MVHVHDDGVFDAPIEKLWKYIQDNDAHLHGAFVVQRVLEQKGNALTIEAKLGNPDGSFSVEKLRWTMNPPKGFDLEYLSGPFRGTRHTHTYTPQGNRTKVVVDGEFVVPPGMTENAVRKGALDYFANAFEEDNTALKSYE